MKGQHITNTQHYKPESKELLNKIDTDFLGKPQKKFFFSGPTTKALIPPPPSAMWS